MGVAVRKGGARTKSVLCIGNEPVRLNRRCSFLQKRGWNIWSSGNIFDGIQRSAGAKISVAVLDLNGDTPELPLVAVELKRVHPDIGVIVLLPPKSVLTDPIPGADVIVSRDDLPLLLKSMETLARKRPKRS